MMTETYTGKVNLSKTFDISYLLDGIKIGVCFHRYRT